MPSASVFFFYATSENPHGEAGRGQVGGGGEGRGVPKAKTKSRNGTVCTIFFFLSHDPIFEVSRVVSLLCGPREGIDRRVLCGG